MVAGSCHSDLTVAGLSGRVLILFFGIMPCNPESDMLKMTAAVPSVRSMEQLLPTRGLVKAFAPWHSLVESVAFPESSTL